MKTFDEVYEKLQNLDNSELNNAWKEAKEEKQKAKKITLIICLIIDILAIIMFFNKGIKINSLIFVMPLIVPVLIINLFVVVITNIIFSKSQNKYNSKYKKIVIDKIMSNFYDSLEYFPQKPMPEYIYKQPKYEYYNKYKSEDYFEAQIDNKYNIQMAEVLAQEEETYRDSDGKTHTRTTTKFHGLFSKIVMQKSIKGELRIMQNGKLLFDKKLKMDSSEFEKYFDVKASNPIVGMQLLTADVMEELIQFENNTKMKFDIYMKEDELYLRFHSGEMFECGNLKNGALDKETIRKYFYMLNFTYNLASRLINVVNETQI